ncbi:MAG TPA: sugar transferase [Thermomicrobiaceae bacterium]|nr:sugar transferase [Thermomicrobiaceae bacterium]
MAECREPVRLVHVMTVPATLPFLRGQAAYLRRHGVAVAAVVTAPGPGLDAFGASEGVPVYPAPMTRRITPLADLIAVVRLYRLLRRLRPDIVHAHTPKGGLLGMLAARLARVPVRVYHLRGLPLATATGSRRRLLRWGEWASCRLAQRVICVSPSLREVALAERLCPPEKIVAPPHGGSRGVDATGRFDPASVDDDARRRARDGLGIPWDAPVVGFVGRVVPDKGLAELGDAWATLREEHAALHLLVAGPEEPDDPLPAPLRARLAADPRVHLTGPVEDVVPLYAAMDVLAFPSRREGLPNVCLEAAAMAVPVVACAIPGVVDAVVDGVTGTLVPSRDAGALAAAVGRYLADPELRRRHGAAGRDRMLRDFRPEEVWDAILAEYRRLLERRATPARPEPGGEPAKRLLDLSLAVPALVLLAPVLVAVSGLVAWRLGRPVLFRQERPGLGGRLFTLYKFRTMTDARDADGRLLPDGERLTHLGRALRGLSLDELPELINVLRGEMSLVGPRPLLPDFLERYTAAEARRHDVLPGITGWAQVHGRNGIPWEERFALDLWYVEHRSLRLDLRILLLTVRAVLRRDGIAYPGEATSPAFRRTPERSP